MGQADPANGGDRAGECAPGGRWVRGRGTGARRSRGGRSAAVGRLRAATAGSRASRPQASPGGRECRSLAASKRWARGRAARRNTRGGFAADSRREGGVEAVVENLPSGLRRMVFLLLLIEGVECERWKGRDVWALIGAFSDLLRKLFFFSFFWFLFLIWFEMFIYTGTKLLWFL
jgi:hypothetical protein